MDLKHNVYWINEVGPILLKQTSCMHMYGFGCIPIVYANSLACHFSRESCFNTNASFIKQMYMYTLCAKFKQCLPKTKTKHFFFDCNIWIVFLNVERLLSCRGYINKWHQIAHINIRRKNMPFKYELKDTNSSW